jgi:diguanylate cyclase (GGDEF)-like protein
MTGSASAREFSRYLEAIVDLTRQQDSQELVGSLLATLSRSVGAAQVRLLALSNPERDADFNESNIQHAVFNDQFDAGSGEPRRLGEEPDLVACVCSGKVVSRGTPTGRRVVFPIFGRRHVRALLVIEQPGDKTLPHELISKLLEVYSNQTLMLSRSELDPLTGLYNRQTFDDRIRRVAQHAAGRRRAADGRIDPGACFALFDIDNFKRVNDEYGHLYGDEVLTLMARLMVQSFRHEDLLFRYGGEEFAVVLVNADLEIAEAALERFRRKVEAHAFPQIGHLTVSIGFTAMGQERGMEQAVTCADKALYFGKNNGRNQSHCYETLVASGKLEPIAEARGGEVELF